MTKTFLKLVRHPAGPIAAVTGDEGKLSIKAPLPNDDRSIIDDRRLVARQFVQIALGVMNLVHRRSGETAIRTGRRRRRAQIGALRTLFRQLDYVSHFARNRSLAQINSIVS